MLKRNPTDFLQRILSLLMKHYTPETKQQSKQWVKAGGSTLKKAKTVLSAGKVMATVFWDFQFFDIVLIDYLEKGKIINGEYYATLFN
jgi:leucyl aminopeptidase (aminopeptidase T)